MFPVILEGAMINVPGPAKLFQDPYAIFPVFLNRGLSIDNHSMFYIYSMKGTSKAAFSPSKGERGGEKVAFCKTFY